MAHLQLAVPSVSANGPAEVQTISQRDLSGLPPPVARYLRRAIPTGLTPPSMRRLEQTGEIRVGARWRTFAATHEMTPPPAHFVWRARILMAPLLTVEVCDSYERGVGSTRATLARVFTVANAKGGASLNAGALHRYLAECVWLPTALLPRYAVMWSPLDRTRALATLSDGGNRVSLEFTFNAADEVVEVFTPARARAVGDTFEPTPWRVRMTRYGEHGGLWVPVEADVAWQIGGEWQSCWRGTVTGGQKSGR